MGRGELISERRILLTSMILFLDLIARSKIRGKPSRLSDSTPGGIGNL